MSFPSVLSQREFRVGVQAVDRPERRLSFDLSKVIMFNGPSISAMSKLGKEGARGEVEKREQTLVK